MTDKFIQQQMYTRERGGIFHDTDGYDTIAISAGLDRAFVKKYLHPFCMYHSPKALAERGEKDVALYPVAVTIFQPETGDLIIGQAVFVPADFTGTRSTYFMHNYIIPSGRKDEWIKRPEKLFQLQEFQTSYDSNLGKVLPEQKNIGHDGTNILTVKNELLGRLGISTAHFKQLLFAVMSSIVGKKKVFISLNGPVADYSKSAMQLLELIYVYLPYAHRRKFGAMTFTSAPESKNYIHVMFYEPGTLNMGDRSIEKQFIFDFAGGWVSGVDIEGQQHEYLDFAMEHFSKSKRVDEFLDFAESALAGLPETQKLELSSYYQLTDLFGTLAGDATSFYSKNKIGFLQSLLKFLQVNSAEKTDLVELFLKLITEEKLADDPGTALDYIDAVVSINTIVRRDESLGFILDTLEYYQHDPLFHRLWKAIEQDKPTHEALVMFINEHPDYEGLLELYLVERFKQLSRVEDILNELSIMLRTPFILNVEMFKTVAIKKIDTAVSLENNPFQAVLAVKDFKMESQNAEFSSFKNRLMAQASMTLLRSIRLQELTIQNVLTFGKVFPKELNVTVMRDMKAKENYLITNGLYQLVNNPSQTGFYNLRSLTSAARERLRSTLQELIRNKLTSEQFQLLVIAFDTEYDGIDYQGLLDYLIRYSDDHTMLTFIRRNARLIETNPTYRRSLRKYLISHPKSIWKNNKLRKDLKLIKSFRSFLKEVETETASPIVKFFKKSGLKLMLVLVIVGGVGGATWFGMDMIFGDHSKPKVAKTSGTEVSVEKTTNEEKKNSPILLDSYKGATKGNAGQTFNLDLEGKHAKNIIGQAEGAILTTINGRVFQLDFQTELGTARPFDKKGKLEDGYSLSGTEYDFDPLDDNSEIVLVAKGTDTAPSFLWVYTINTDSLNVTPEQLMPILKVNGILDVTLADKSLSFPMGDKSINYEYSTETHKLVESKK